MDDIAPDRLVSGPLRVIAVLGGTNLILATVGYRAYLDDGRFSDALFHGLNLMFLNYHVVDGQLTPPLILDVARYLAHLVAVLAVVVALLALLRGRVDRWRSRRDRGQVVVVGTSALAIDVVLAYRARPGRQRVTLVSSLDDHGRRELRSAGVWVVEGTTGEELAAIVDGAERVVVAGGDDDETLRLLAALPSGAAPVHALIRAAEVAAELRGRTAVFGPSATDVCCAGERVASAILALEPPRRDGHVSPPAVILGTGLLATELLRRVAFGWARPGDPVPIVRFGPDLVWPSELEDACRGRADVRTVEDVWSVRAARRLVEAVAVEQRPSERERTRRQEDGALVTIVGLPDAVTVTLAARIVTTVPRVRVVAVVTDDASRVELAPAARASGASLRLLSERRLLSTPQFLEADAAYRLAEELHRDALRWPAEVPSALGQLPDVPFDELDQSVRDRLRRLAEAIPTAFTAAGLVLDDEGEVAALGPTTIATIAEHLDPSLLAVEETGTDPFEPTGRYARLALAASLPIVAARTGLVVRPGPGTDVLTPDELEAMAVAAHDRYVALQAEQGNLTGSELAALQWDQLDDFAKESNRAQARDVPVKLASAGFALERGADASGPGWLDEPTIERLARYEHARWAHLHVLAGYRWAPVTSHADRVHAELVPWDELGPPDAEGRGPKDLDRDAVRNIPALLAAAGLRAVRADEPAEVGA